MSRLTDIPSRDRFILPWFIGFGLITTISAIIYAIGYPIGASFISHVINISKYVSINVLLFLATTFFLSAFFSFIYLPVPRIFLASFTYTLVSSIAVLIFDNSGEIFSYIVGLAYSILGIFISLICAILLSRSTPKWSKYFTLIATTILMVSFFHILLKKEINPVLEPAKKAEVATVEKNPANKGSFDFHFITYGSGQDQQRDWFGKDVDERTPTVDSSHFITRWGEEKEDFWGFNENRLPINGRAWIPEGDGPFPIVLMVHGNHTMEYFSTSGYDYLGEQLASRGFIAISVDEDFINYSNTYGSPNRNYELRAWMIMQHLAHLQTMNQMPDSSFYEKIDFQQVGLMGHSRGGQAVLMVEDYETFFSDLADEELLESMENISIQGIVSIAPTNKLINDEHPAIHNTSYLLIHGARDADVSDFSNDKHFYRTTFDPEHNGFKASVYIDGANHTQFNTDWGRMDLSLPRGLFLNQKKILKPKEQQKLAKIYMTAFFERVFHQDQTFEKLFANPQYGRKWLPKTQLITKYKHASHQTLLTFQDESDLHNVESEAHLEIITPKHRRGSDRIRNALKLGWNEETSVSFQLPNVHVKEQNNLSLLMANYSEERPEIIIELETTSGSSEMISLDSIIPFPPIISVDYTHFGWFDEIFREDRYKNSWEPVFQTFTIPLDLFAKLNQHQETIDRMTLHFLSDHGKILIEEIGYY